MTARAALPITAAWAHETGGALDANERRAVRRAIARSLLDAARGVLAWPVHRIPPVTAPSPPDSRLARAAEEAASDQGDTLAGHGYRTWILGHALAVHDRRAPDPELFYVAALLHDSGLTTAVTGQDFTIRSAHTVTTVATSAAPDRPDIGRTLADAVVAHATPGLTPDDDPIGYYVQAGAMADLAALRRWHLPRGYIKAAYDTHTGNDVHTAIADCMRDEADAVPGGRFALLHASGTSFMIRHSPNRRLTRH